MFKNAYERKKWSKTVIDGVRRSETDENGEKRWDKNANADVTLTIKR